MHIAIVLDRKMHFAVISLANCILQLILVAVIKPVQNTMAVGSVVGAGLGPRVGMADSVKKLLVTNYHDRGSNKKG